MSTGQHLQNLRSPLAQPEIESIWVAAAQAMGWRVMRQSAAYASTDGAGGMMIGVDDILDADDAAAQLIFHELCHGLVEGPSRWSTPDWGLTNTDPRDVAHEHACLRVQVFLTEKHGLRELMAPTTEYRAYHDDIAGDPLANESDPAAGLARGAIERADARVWLDLLGRALADTRTTLDASAVQPTRNASPGALHPVGFRFLDATDADAGANDQSCGSCAWLYRGGRGRPVERCRQSAGHDGNGRRTDSHYRACERWEARVDCQACGACCREAYHSVTISMRDPVVWKRPELVVRSGHRFEILRAGDRCAALHGQGASDSAGAFEGVAGPAFSCAIYDERPRPCREFEAGGRHCLVARRRVGLSA